MKKILRDNELIKALCNTFGPSGCEEAVAALVKEQICDLCNDITTDKLGNVITRLSFGEGEKKKIMITAHMDEVGFMITEVCDNGYLRFDTIGGISTDVLSGKHIELLDGKELICGVISSKAIHHKKKDERGKCAPIDKLYIDIGAKDREDAIMHADIGSFGAFAPNYTRFGEGERMISAKAIDDRLGCALLIELMRRLCNDPPAYPCELYFCFTVREEVGLSGAQVAAQTIMPDYAIVLETTAVADITDVDEAKKVAFLGEGGAISLMDNSTIYDREMIDMALEVAEKNGIKAQIKKYVSGGNDAKHIQRSGVGVRTLALSAPTRYLHSPTCVACYDDYLSMLDLLEQIIHSKRLK